MHFFFQASGKKAVHFKETVLKRIIRSDEAFQDAMDIEEETNFDTYTDCLNNLMIEEDLNQSKLIFNPSMFAIFPCVAGLYALVLALQKTEWVITTIEAASGLRV